MTASKIQLFNVRPHSAANSYWQEHWDRIVPKTRGSIRIFMRLPFLCSGHLTGYGFWKLFRSKIPPLCVELRSKSCFLGKTWLHLHPTFVGMWGKLPCRQQHWSGFSTFKTECKSCHPTTCSSSFQNIWILPQSTTEHTNISSLH